MTTFHFYKTFYEKAIKQLETQNVDTEILENIKDYIKALEEEIDYMMDESISQTENTRHYASKISHIRDELDNLNKEILIDTVL